MLTPPVLYLAQIKLLYNLTILCLDGTLSCADFVDVIMGDIRVERQARI